MNISVNVFKFIEIQYIYKLYLKIKLSKKMKSVKLNSIEFNNNNNFVLIAGPCVIENKEMPYAIVEEILRITQRLSIQYVFKASYKKANRTSLNSFTGIEFEEAIKILDDIRKKYNVPVVTDIHTEKEAEIVKDYVDMLQIPAFLCRQTDLLLAAGNTEKVINIKKGQFLAPEDMKYAISKIETTGNEKILLTERGTTFGYHNLVVDMRGLEIMKDTGYPVIMDATHSVQIPSNGGVSGGLPRFIEPLARAAISLGIAGLFMEIHPEPAKALSDAGSQFPLKELEKFLKRIKQIDELVKKF